MIFYIVEHPTRGVLMDWDWVVGECKPRYSWSRKRTEGCKFFSPREAAHRLRNVPLAKGSYLLEFPGATRVEGWCPQPNDARR